MKSPLPSKSPQTAQPRQMYGLRLDLLGFMFHLSWMYLFLYVANPAGAAGSFVETGSGILASTSPTLLYTASAAALIGILAAFALRPDDALRIARKPAVNLGASVLTALGTLAYCLAYYTGLEAIDAVAIGAGVATGLGSGALACRWAHAFGSAGVAGALESTPCILAGIIAICVTTPYLPLIAGVVLVVVLPLLSGFCVSRADAFPRTSEQQKRERPSQGRLYAGLSLGIAALGAILGHLNSSTASPMFSEYLTIFFLTATAAVLAASAMFIFKNRRNGFTLELVVPLGVIGCLTVLLVQINQAEFFSSFIPIGSVCLEMLFLVTLVIFAKRFGLSAVRTFALGRIVYAASNLAGTNASQRLAASGEALATVQATSFMLFAGIELVAVAAVLVLVLARQPHDPVSEAPAAIGGSGPIGQFKSKLERFANEYRLSARESDVTEQLVKGRGYARIQQELNIAEGTVNYHTRNIYAKTGVHTREDLIDLFDDFE